MAPRLSLAALTAIGMSGCVQRSDLGGQKSASCAPSCETSDAGPPLDARVLRPDSRVRSESPEQLAELEAALDGLWWGFAERASLVDGVDSRTPIEITFTRPRKPAKGTFRVRCLAEPECDPFGFGRASPDEGAFELLNLDPSEGGSGGFTWSARDSQFSAPFRYLRVTPAGGPALTFSVGFLSGSPRSSIATTVVLAFGPPPQDAGLHTGVDADAGQP